MGNGAQEMGSTPYSGTIQDLTFNLFSILADQYLSANALFWITVWITAVGLDPGTASRGSSFAALPSWTPNRGYWEWLRDLDRIGSRGGSLCLGVVVPRTSGGDGLVVPMTSSFVRASNEVQALQKVTNQVHIR